MSNTTNQTHTFFLLHSQFTSITESNQNLEVAMVSHLDQMHAMNIKVYNVYYFS